eukprot:jgi/Mesvir1/5638/Mv15656-RA.1
MIPKWRMPTEQRIADIKERGRERERLNYQDVLEANKRKIDRLIPEKLRETRKEVAALRKQWARTETDDASRKLLHQMANLKDRARDYKRAQAILGRIDRTFKDLDDFKLKRRPYPAPKAQKREELDDDMADDWDKMDIDLLLKDLPTYDCGQLDTPMQAMRVLVEPPRPAAVAYEIHHPVVLEDLSSLSYDSALNKVMGSLIEIL